ncbi:acyl-CoA dehydratase activase [Clostridium sp. HMP27]|uniref:acyl-CoA dehydratase activase n=1 Tax=Clostridium sp. HMP27 TaxID=1487921 RepID=UPI00052D1AEE|nr:acyl-CoA dehydratase activase [Clostridium sp. HMP27]KGK88830.1 2-hydroxyglutaryl-CoA dehydratase [Clostridium sp. HMP27]
MYYMGIDVGSVSTDIVLIDEESNVVDGLYLRTKGRPIQVIQDGFRKLREKYRDEDIRSVGTTGSGRKISGFLVGADSVKNEITAHAVAALEIDPQVKTIIEIGGQDSKIIILKDGIVTDFAMNTVCAAGTGSFLDRQAERLGVPIENFGVMALESKNSVRIAGRCAVFAESDMIHKQQVGHKQEDIIRGLCEALVRNYLNNVGKGKDIKDKIFFQGGVAANEGMKKVFEETLGTNVYVPKHYGLMGAIGAAILSKERVKAQGYTNFKGFNVSESAFSSESFECTGCPNGCEIISIKSDGVIIGNLGDRCGKWSSVNSQVTVSS